MLLIGKPEVPDFGVLLPVNAFQLEQLLGDSQSLTIAPGISRSGAPSANTIIERARILAFAAVPKHGRGGVLITGRLGVAGDKLQLPPYEPIDRLLVFGPLR